MAYDEALAVRMRKALARRRGITEKKMFGGLAFMLRGNMCVGIVKSDLMVRVGPERFAACLEDPQARPMDFTGRPMRGYVYVDGTVDDDDLKEWIDLGVAFAKTLPAK